MTYGFHRFIANSKFCKAFLMPLSRVRDSAIGPRTANAAPKPAWATDLARVAIESFHADVLHENHLSELVLPASERAITSAFVFTYLASQLSEEGCPVRFRIAIVGKGQVHACGFPLVSRFGKPIALDNPRALKKFAVAIDRPGAVLLVTEAESDGEIVCHGVAVDKAFECAPGYLPSGSAQEGICFDIIARVWITVTRPGYLISKIAGRGIVLQDGEISGLVHLSRVDAFDALLETMTCFITHLRDDAPYPQEETSSKIGPFTIYRDIAYWIQLIVSSIVRSRRGGTLVFPPCRYDFAEQKSFEGGTEVDIHFGQTLVDLHLACIAFDSEGADTDGFGTGSRDLEATDEWTLRYSIAKLQADFIASFAGIDGCVVIDRSFRLARFGSKIVHEPPILRFVDAYNHTLDLSKELESLGTRHKSAVGFCRAHPDAVVIVISQDGDIRVFYSDDHGAYGIDGLSS